MTKNKNPNNKSLVDIAVDPDVLARELALEIEIDPLEQIDKDAFSKGLNITQECNEALTAKKAIPKSETIAKGRIFVLIKPKDLRLITIIITCLRDF